MKSPVAIEDLQATNVDHEVSLETCSLHKVSIFHNSRTTTLTPKDGAATSHHAVVLESRAVNHLDLGQRTTDGTMPTRSCPPSPSF